MRKINLTIDGKTHEATLPETWREVKVSHYKMLVQLDKLEFDSSFEKDVAILSQFIGVDMDVIELMEVEEFNTLVETLSFLKDEKLEFPTLKETIDIDGKTWFIKKDFDKLTIGERITFDVFLNGKKSPDLDLDLFLTLFIKETKDETWKNSHKERSEIFNNMPFVDVKPVLDFFLTGILSSNKNMKHFSEDPEDKTKVEEKKEKDLKEE